MDRKENRDQTRGLLELPPEILALVLRQIVPCCIYLKEKPFTSPLQRCLEVYQRWSLEPLQRLPYTGYQNDDCGVMLNNTTNLRLVNRRMNDEVCEMMYRTTELRFLCEDLVRSKDFLSSLPTIHYQPKTRSGSDLSMLRWLVRFSNITVTLFDTHVYKQVSYSAITKQFKSLLRAIHQDHPKRTTNLTLATFNQSKTLHTRSEKFDILSQMLCAATEIGSFSITVMFSHCYHFKPSYSRILWNSKYGKTFKGYCETHDILVVESLGYDSDLTEVVIRSPLDCVRNGELSWLRGFKPVTNNKALFTWRWQKHRIIWNERLRRCEEATLNPPKKRGRPKSSPWLAKCLRHGQRYGHE